MVREFTKHITGGHDIYPTDCMTVTKLQRASETPSWPIPRICMTRIEAGLHSVMVTLIHEKRWSFQGEGVRTYWLAA
jgi:hypothetical protein